METSIMESTLGELAVSDLRKVEVFKKYGLDFCCGGKKTIKQACAEKELDGDKVEQDLQLADKTPVSRPLSYSKWPVEFLADYVVNIHHDYVRLTLPELMRVASKVARVHGIRHPELLIIQRLIEHMSSEMTAHMEKEETILFPYIKKLSSKNSSSIKFSDFGTVQNPIHILEMEHETVGNLLEEIRMYSNEFVVPSDACSSYSLLYKMLAEFEEDLHIHVHLENNILFPRALMMERTLKGENNNLTSCRV